MIDDHDDLRSMTPLLLGDEILEGLYVYILQESFQVGGWKGNTAVTVRCYAFTSPWISFWTSFSPRHTYLRQSRCNDSRTEPADVIGVSYAVVCANGLFGCFSSKTAKQRLKIFGPDYKLYLCITHTVCQNRALAAACMDTDRPIEIVGFSSALRYKRTWNIAVDYQIFKSISFWTALKPLYNLLCTNRHVP